MSKDPAFLLYPNDLEGGTRHMTDEEFGCYIRLLLAQFNRGGILPNDEKILSRYCTSFEKSWHIVKEKFLPAGNGKIKNKRLSIEMEKRAEKSKKQSINAKKGWSKPDDAVASIRHKNGIPSADAIIGNGNGIGVGNGYGNEIKGGPGENWILTKTKWLADVRWKEVFCMNKNIQPIELEKKMFEFISDIEVKEDFKAIGGLKSHFTNWFNKRQNGSETHQRTTTSSTKQGTSEARVQALKKW